MYTRDRKMSSLKRVISLIQSEVMSAGFAKFHPNLVVGGTYSGQIVLWDNRSNKRTPVQRTPLSAAAHTVITPPPPAPTPIPLVQVEFWI